MIRPRLGKVLLTLCASALGCGSSPSGEPASGGNGGAAAAAGATTAGGTGASGGVGAPGGAGADAAPAVAGNGAIGAAGAAGGTTNGAGTGGAAGFAGTHDGSNGGSAGRGVAGSGGSATGGAPGGIASGGSAGAAGGPSCGPVTAVPDAVRTRLGLDAFYRKYVDANGLPVIASDAPADESLILACKLLLNMLSKRDDVRQELIRRKARFAIIGKNEGTADIPEYGYRGKPQSEIDAINERARGLGGQVASCGEENILCLKGDRYYNESICVHEFSHTITTYGAYTADRSFEDDLQAAYQSALASGILDDTYRNSNLQEYWAEGVQDWYDTNASSNPPNGVHNQVNTRVELETYDPTLYELVSGMFPEDTAWGDCHAAD